MAHTLEVDLQHPAADWLWHYRDWYQANALVLRWTEKVLVHPEWGYAGTADLLIEHPVHGLTLVDLKTTKIGKQNGGHGVTRPTRFTPYKSWCYQLAAYRRALGEPVRCMNLIVNSGGPSVPVEHLWSEEEMERGWEGFRAAHRLWVIEKGYDPSAECGTRSAEIALAE